MARTVPSLLATASDDATIMEMEVVVVTPEHASERLQRGGLSA